MSRAPVVVRTVTKRLVGSLSQRLFTAAVALCLVAWGIQRARGEVLPGNAWEVAYGVACSVFLLAVAFFGLRRRLPAMASRLRLGSARAWLRFHLYGGGIFLLLMFLHTGFRLPHGAMTGWIWGLSLWTVVSGLLGTVLQRWLPRVLSSGLTSEVLYDRIPSLVDDLRQRSEALAATCGEAVEALYRREVAPAVEAPRRRLIYFVDVTGGIQTRLRAFDYLRTFLTGEDRDRLDELETLVRSKLELDAHYTLQWPLRWWLMIHVPLSLVLLVLVGVHVGAVLYY